MPYVNIVVIGLHVYELHPYTAYMSEFIFQMRGKYCHNRDGPILTTIKALGIA